MSVVAFTADRHNTPVFSEIEDLDGVMRRAIRQTWFSLARDLSKTAKTEIRRKPKSGRTYIIRDKRGRRRRHVASAPGETHANISGMLARSVTWKVHGMDSMDWGYGIVGGDAPERGEWLEDGTLSRADGGTLMEARPSLQNAITATQGNVQDHFGRHMAAQLQRSLTR